MAFKIKDLMINVASSAPHEGAGEAAFRGCVGRCNTLQSGAYACTLSFFTTPWTITFPTITCTCTTKSGIPFPTITCTCTTKTGRWFEGPFGCMVTAPDPPEETLDNLATLKAELQAALAEVDEQMKTIEKGLQPSSVEEVETLESKLKDALKELDRMKSELKKKR